jgi:hypothetical protein
VTKFDVKHWLIRVREDRTEKRRGGGEENVVHANLEK